MISPLISVMNLMYTAVPIYEWEPVPPPAPSADGETSAAAPANDGAACEGSSEAQAPLQLVFKGLRWVPVQMWSLRENAAWEQINQDQRDEESRRSEERSRQAQRVEAEVGPQGADDSAAAPAKTKGSDD